MKIPIQDDKTCEQAYRKNKKRDKTRIIFDDMLCAGTLGRGPCLVSCPGPCDLPTSAPDASPFKGGWIREFPSALPLTGSPLFLQGDSGGPLVCWKSNKWTQVGVVSWGRDCGSRLPSVFSRVQSSLAWIRQHTT